MKEFAAKLKEKMSSLSKIKKISISIAIYSIFFAITVFLFSIYFKPFLYGFNFDWYLYLSTYKFSFSGLLLSTHPIGFSFVKILSLIFGANASVFNAFTVIGLYAIALVLFFVFRLAGKNCLHSLFAVFIITCSLTFYTVFYETRGSQFLFAPLFLSLTILFYYLNKNKQKTAFAVLTLVFLALFIIEFPTPLILLPALLAIILKDKRNVKTIIIACITLLLSTLSSIRSFIQYTDLSDKYLAYTFDGILNLVNIPQSYSYNYYFTFSTVTPLSRTLIIISAVIYIVFVLAAIVTLVMRVIETKSKESKIMITLLVVQFLIAFALIGFVRYDSILSLSPLTIALVLFALKTYDTNAEFKKLRLTSISAVAAIVGMLLCITPFYSAYAKSNIKYMEERIKYVNGLGKKPNVVAVCYNHEYQKWNLLSYFLNGKYNFDVVNLNDNNYYAPEKFSNGNAFYGFGSEKLINKGVTIKDAWITGNSYETLVYTTTTDLTVRYSIPAEFPPNTFSFYFNDVLVEQKVDWKGSSEFNYKVNEKTGAFVYLKIVCEKAFRPADYIEHNEDYRYFSLFINQLILE